jgi:hypothetical protein
MVPCMMVLYDLTMLETQAGPILIVTGALTMLAAAAIVAPTAVLRGVFGSAAPDRVSRAVTRHWGLLVALFGALLVYAGYHPEVRAPVMLAAAIEKLGVAAIFGIALPRRPLLVAVIAGDAVMAIIYLVILGASLRSLPVQ